MKEKQNRKENEKYYKFEEVSAFNYLGPTVGKTEKERVQEKMLTRNQAYGLKHY